MLVAQTLATSAADSGGPVFHAGTQEVLVDAIVADKKGNIQRDLTREDFQIWEDGKRQKVTGFSLESAAVPGKRFIALAFERERPGLREEVIQFVDRSADPSLYLAVFSRVNSEMRLQQPFTTDVGRIKAALRTMQISTTGGLDGMFQGTDISRVHDPFCDRIGRVAAALAPVRGRKAMILFGEGYFVKRGAAQVTDRNYKMPPVLAREIAQIGNTIDDCNAANVSLYSFLLKPGHVDRAEVFYNPTQNDSGATTDIIRDIATGTGGKYTPPGTYDMADYLGALAAEQSGHYLLSYAPSAAAADKPCHKVIVKVDRRGLDVDARDSYCMAGQSTARSLKPAQRALDARTASGVPGNIAAAMQLSWFYSKPGAAMLDIALDIDPRSMKMRGKLQGEFNLLGIAYRQDGSVATRIPDDVELNFDTPAQLDAFLKTPYHYSKQFSIAPGQYRFLMAVGSGDKAFGSAEEPLDIELWSGRTLR